MHMREGRLDLALDEFKKAVKADPKNPYFQKGLGQAYAAKRKWDDAADAFRKALELNPYYVDVRNDLGMALILGGNREAGKKEFLTAFGDPTNPTPEISARNLGQVYFEEKNYAESASWFRTSVNRNKSYGEAYLGLADALAASGRPEEALLQLEAGVKEAPDDRDARAHPGPGLPEGRALQRGAGAARGRGEEGSHGARRPPARPSCSRTSPSRPVPYLVILQKLLEAVAGAQAALLLDAQGEVVVEAGCSDDRHRLIAAYHGIALATVQRAAERYDVGALAPRRVPLRLGERDPAPAQGRLLPDHVPRRGREPGRGRAPLRAGAAEPERGDLTAGSRR